MLKRWQMLLIGAVVAMGGIINLFFFGTSIFYTKGQILPSAVLNTMTFLGMSGYIGWFASNLVYISSVYAGFVLPSRRPSRRKLAQLCLVVAIIATLFGLKLGYLAGSVSGLSLFQSLLYMATSGLGLWFLFVTREDPIYTPRRRFRPVAAESAREHKEVTPTIEDGPNWHADLLTSLDETSPQIAPRPKQWPVMLALIGFVASVQIISLITDAVIKDPNQRLIIAYVETFVFLLAFAWPIAMLRRRFNAVKARRAEETLKKKADKRPIFYLRSFGLDDELGKPSILELFLNVQPGNAEQTLTASLSRCGPVIAIGRPSEKLPSLGASRFYVTDDRWQEKVADVARLSRLVVWASGTTRGLQWEISHLVRSLPPEKLILWPHPQLLDLDEDEREVEWCAFMRGLGQLFPVSLPMPLGDTRFFAFDKDFKPIPYKGANALSNLLTDKAIPPYDPAGAARMKKVRKWVQMGAATVGGLIALFFISIMTMRGLPLKPEPLSWNLLASDLIYDERSSEYAWNAATASGQSVPRTPAHVIDALKATEAELKPHWFGKNWQQVPPGRLGPLSQAAKTYRSAFELAGTDPALEALFYGKGTAQVFQIDGLPMARARLKQISDLRRSLETTEAEWRQLSAANPTYALPQRLHAYIVARQELLDSEIAILRSLVNHPDNWSIGYDIYNERQPRAYPDSYRDQLQGLINEREQALKSFRATQAALN